MGLSFELPLTARASFVALGWRHRSVVIRHPQTCAPSFIPDGRVLRSFCCALYGDFMDPSELYTGC